MSNVIEYLITKRKKMTPIFLFELKKLWKQKVTVSVIVLALILSFYAVIVIPNTEIFQPPLTTDIFQYSPSTFLGLNSPSRQDDGSYTSNHYNDWQEMFSYHEVPIRQNIKMDEHIRTRTTTLAGSSEIFRKLDFFLHRHQYEFTSQARDDLDFAILLYDYYLQHGIDKIYPPIAPDQYIDVETTILPSGAFETLSSRTHILFGIIPFVLFFFLGYTIFTREFQTNRHQLLWMQPSKKAYLFFIQYLSVALQVVIYLIALVVSVMFLHFIRGDGIGLFDLPLRIFLPGVHYYTQWQYIVLTMGLFIIKSLLFIAMGVLVALFVKQFDRGIFIALFIGTTAFYLTQIMEKLQFAFNPFYMNYEEILLGSRIEVRTGELGYAYQSVLPVGFVPILIFLIASIFLLLLAFKLRHRRFLQSESLKNSPLRSGFHFELRKYLRLIPLKWLSSGILLLSFIIFLGMTIPDYLNRENTISAYKLDAQIQENAMKQFEQNYTEIKDSDLDAVAKDQILEKILSDIEVAREKINLSKEIVESLQSNDSTHFYENMLREMDDKINSKGYVFITSELKAKELSRFSQDVMKKRYNWSISHEVKPILYPSFELANISIYDESATNVSLDQLHKEKSQPLDFSSGMLLYRLITYYSLHLFLLGGILLMFGGGYYLERIGKESIHLLYTQPKSRTFYYHRKWQSSVVLAILLSLSFIGLILIVGLWGKPSNTWHFPILYYDQFVGDAFVKTNYSESFHFVSLGIWLLKALALFVSMLLCCLSMMQALSVHIKSRWIVYSLVFGGGLVLMFISPSMGSVAPYLPFSYWNLPHLLTGRLAVESNSSLVFINAILIHVFWALLWYVGGLLFIRSE